MFREPSLRNGPEDPSPRFAPYTRNYWSRCKDDGKGQEGFREEEKGCRDLATCRSKAASDALSKVRNMVKMHSACALRMCFLEPGMQRLSYARSFQMDLPKKDSTTIMDYPALQTQYYRNGVFWA